MPGRHCSEQQQGRHCDRNTAAAAADTVEGDTAKIQSEYSAAAEDEELEDRTAVGDIEQPPQPSPADQCRLAAAAADCCYHRRRWSAEPCAPAPVVAAHPAAWSPAERMQSQCLKRC